MSKRKATHNERQIIKAYLRRLPMEIISRSALQKLQLSQSIVQAVTAYIITGGDKYGKTHKYP